MLSDWLTSVELAAIAKISRQAAHKALAKVHSGITATWRGAVLEVRVRHGRGGRSGIQYEVAGSSLPMDLQTDLKERLKAGKHLSKIKTDTKAAACAQSRFDVIAKALAFPRHSPERVQAISDAVGQKVLSKGGRLGAASETVIRDWISKYESDGLVGLLPRQKFNKGVPKTVISLAWDRAMEGNVSQADQLLTLQLVQEEIRSLYASGHPRKLVRAMVGQNLQRVTAAFGVCAEDAIELARICNIPERLINAEVHYRKKRQLTHDRKRYEDNKPRIRRTHFGLEPMSVLCLDVHHVDLWIEAADGKLKTPYLLAFMDIATCRVWCEVVFCEHRGGVRNIDLITAMVNLLRHPSWGVPQVIYCDNGKEYSFTDDLIDLTQLGVEINSKSETGVKRAIPYNAAAKRVELFFNHFEQMLAIAPSHIGGNRLDQKRPSMGKQHVGFPGGFDAFNELLFGGLLPAYEHIEIGGQMKGRSPNQAFQEWVDRGWQATLVDPADILTVFTTPKIRTVRQHAFRLNGRYWTCDELLSYFGDRLTCRVPKWHGYNEVRIEDLNGQLIGIAKPDEEFEYLDPRGAKESARRVKIQKKALKDLGGDLPKSDHTNIIEFAAHIERPVPNQPNGIVRVNTDGPAAKIITPSAKPSYGEPTEKELEEVRRLRAMAARAIIGKGSDS